MVQQFVVVFWACLLLPTVLANSILFDMFVERSKIPYAKIWSQSTDAETKADPNQAIANINGGSISNTNSGFLKLPGRIAVADVEVVAEPVAEPKTATNAQLISQIRADILKSKKSVMNTRRAIESRVKQLKLSKFRCLFNPVSC